MEMLQVIEQPRSLTVGEIIFVSREVTAYAPQYQEMIYELTAVQVKQIYMQDAIDLYQVKLMEIYGREQVYSDRHDALIYRWKSPLSSLSEAVSLYEDAVVKRADAGDAKAMYALARYFYQTPTRDLTVFHAAMLKSKAYFERASAAGHALASFDLSKYYFLILGKERQVYFEQQREHWHHFYLQRSAEQGYALAQYNLAYYFEYAEHGFEQDDEKAVYWYQHAAAQNYPEAINNLGDKYERGRGVKRDLQQAAKYYQQAAQLNIVEAMYNLGRLYLKGAGVTKDEVLAKYWLTESAQRAYAPARRKLRSLEKSS